MSPSVLIVADDFTGGNAVAATFAAQGRQVVNLSLPAGPHPNPPCEDFEVVVVSTDSRHDSPSDSAAKLRAAVDWIGPAELYGSRIDTTLRGNLASTTAALLGAVRSRHSQRVACLCVPAHPAAGRQTVGGRQLLRGVRLEDTELATDPMNPVLSSDLTSVLTVDSALKVALTSLETVTGPLSELGQAMRQQAMTADVLVVDALTEEHLARIAAAAATCVDAVRWVTADPGPFSMALASALGLVTQDLVDPGPVLVISGSASALTRRQLHRLRELPGTTVVLAADLARERGAHVDRSVADHLSEALARAGSDDVVLLATAVDDSHVRSDHEMSKSLPARLARVVGMGTTTCRPAAMCLIGGDITSAVLTELRADGLAVDGEVVPLAVTGRVVGGPLAGTPIVTKGGLVGDVDTAIECVDALRSMLRRSHRHPNTHLSPLGES